jgi:fructoselysine-6-P-deglycase FrlB-like protein
MSIVADEIQTQPDLWRRAGGLASDVAPLLGARGERACVVGCGTSLYVAQAWAALREAAGHGETDAFPASELPPGRRYDVLVAISRSGTTTEVIELLEVLRERGQRVTAIVATAGTTIPELATECLLLPEVDEQSVVQTRFATTTLALLRATLGEDLTTAIAQARNVLAEEESSAIEGVIDAEQITFVGRGWTVGLANEAALKLRESAQFWTESYPAMEYRHGPISIATTGRATWAFGEVPDGLSEDVTATGAHFEHRDIDPLADLVRLHRLCLAKARLAGVDPDRPRHLSRSIILS